MWNYIISKRQLKLSRLEQNYTTDYTAHRWLSWLSIGLLSAGDREFDSGRTNTQELRLKVLQYAVLSSTSQPRAFHEDHGNKNGNSSNKQRIVHYCFNGNNWCFQLAHNAISDIWVTWRLIGHFRITFGLFFKASSGTHPFLMKISSFACEWKKGWAPVLALKKRPKVIRKWPITEKAVSYWEGGEARNLARDFDRFLSYSRVIFTISLQSVFPVMSIISFCYGRVIKESHFFEVLCHCIRWRIRFWTHKRSSFLWCLFVALWIF